MAQTLGIIDLVWNGTKIPIEKNGKVKLGGMQQNAVITGRQVDYSNEFMASEITATTVIKRGQSVLSLYAVGAGELQVLCDTGQTFVWPDAFLSNRPEFEGGAGGKMQMKWDAGEPTELLNG